MTSFLTWGWVFRSGCVVLKEQVLVKYHIHQCYKVYVVKLCFIIKSNFGGVRYIKLMVDYFDLNCDLD